MTRYAVDTDILANIQRAGHAETLGRLGPLPVVITDAVWDELTVNARLSGAPPRWVKEADDMLRAIAGAPMLLLPQSPEARTLVQLQHPPPTEGLGEHSVIAYAFHHADVTVVLNDRRALHRVRGRILSWHGFLEALRSGHGLTKRAADELSSWYCTRFVPQRPPVWW